MNTIVFTILISSLFISEGVGFRCLQCKSADSPFCQLGLVPATKCDPGAIGCLTYVGRMPFGEHFVIRDCTDKPKDDFCTTVPGMPESHVICMQTCFVSGCNKEMIGSEHRIENIIFK